MELPPPSPYCKSFYPGRLFTYLGESPLDPDIVDFVFSNVVGPQKSGVLSHHRPGQGLPAGLIGFIGNEEQLALKTLPGDEMILCTDPPGRSKIVESLRTIIVSKPVIHDF